VTGSRVVELGIAAVSLGSMYALLALGLVIVFGILRLINFAYGEFLMVGGYAMVAFQRVVVGVPWAMEAVLSAFVVMLTAVALERVAFRPVRATHGPPIILQSLAMVLISPRSKGIEYPAVVAARVTVGPLQIAVIDLVALVVSGLSLLGLLFLLRRTFLGVCLRAAADDFTMTRLLGVRANRVIASAFAVSGGLAGISALLYFARIGLVKPDIGLGPVIIAFFASVVGGIESLTGAVVGGFVLGFLTIGLQVALPASLLVYRDAFLFLVVIVILLFRPQGLVPGRQAQGVR
jgi:branched-chain amino acid transport system permease protein